jgi:hypothetical protein
MNYAVQAITQFRTKDGKTRPKSPCGVAVPVGYHLSEDGSEYVRDKDDNERLRTLTEKRKTK